MPRSFDSVFYGAAGTPTGASDDEFNRVSFLSHFEGSNNGVNNVFDDGSASNHTISAAGNVTQGSFGPFARPAGNFSQRNYASVGGTTNQTSWVQAPDSADFDLLVTGDFTIEFWVNFLKTEATILFGQSNGGGGQPKWNLNLDQAIADNLAFHLGGGGNLGVPFAPDANRWYYIAVTRDGNNYRFYADGAQLGSTVSSSARSSASSAVLQIGAGESYLGLGGYISNLRFVKGTALYTGSTHAVPTGPTTKVTNTVLLCCQDNRFVDNSDSAHVLTPNKLTLPDYAEVSAFGPFLTSAVYDPAVNGASAFFDGTGDQISAADSSDFDVGAGLFTAEAWVYPTNPASQAIIMGQWTGSYAWALMLSNDGNRTLRYIIKSGGSFYDKIADNTGLPLNAWSHVAFSRASGNVFAIYVNGTRVRTDTLNYTINNSTGVLGVGGNSGSYWGGYISDARMVKGTAVYAGASYTVPTAPLTAITNTKLLLNMADGQAIDSAAQNNMTLAGNANTSTDQAKFGTASLHLDGTGDYAEVTSGIGAWSTGNFTVEGWYYLTALAQYDNLFDFRTSGNTSHLDIYFDDDPLRMHVFFGGADRINANAATPTNEWVHIAVVRNGSTTTLYQNGTSLGTSTTVTTFTEGALRIGNRYSGDYYMQGYVDDFRVSNMARYTGNFTAPAEPFADKGQDA